MTRNRRWWPVKFASRTWPALAGLSLAATFLVASRPADSSLASGDGGPGLGEVRLHLLVPAGDGYDELHVSLLFADDGELAAADRHATALAAFSERFPEAIEVLEAEVAPQYRLYSARWAEPAAAWLYNPAGANPSLSEGGAFAAVQAGAEGWSGAGGTDWKFEYTGTTTNGTGCNGVPGSIPKDGKNVVGWGPIIGDYWGYACWWSGSAIPGTGFNRMTEFDIVFRQDVAFSSVQLYRIALHEFGHALGLDHTQASNCPGTVMCPAANVGSLQPDDLAGILALYGPAATPVATRTPTTAPTPTAPATPPLPAGPFRAVVPLVARSQ